MRRWKQEPFSNRVGCHRPADSSYCAKHRGPRPQWAPSQARSNCYFQHKNLKWRKNVGKSGRDCAQFFATVTLSNANRSANQKNSAPFYHKWPNQVAALQKVSCCGPDKRNRHSFAATASKPDCLPRKPALPASPWSSWQVLCASPKAASPVTAKRNSMLWPTGDATKQQEKCNPTCTGQKPTEIASPLSRKSKKACWGLVVGHG